MKTNPELVTAIKAQYKALHYQRPGETLAPICVVMEIFWNHSLDHECDGPDDDVVWQWCDLHEIQAKRYENVMHECWSCKALFRGIVHECGDGV